MTRSKIDLYDPELSINSPTDTGPEAAGTGSAVWAVSGIPTIEMKAMRNNVRIVGD